MSDPDFAELLRRVRAGDEQAAAEILRRYEPAIRTEVRMRLVDSRVRRVFDTMDVCQSVFASFFLRAATGQYVLDQPDQLIRLLASIARNKVAFQVRMQRAQRRDSRREVGAMSAAEVATKDPSPSRIITGRDMLEEFRRRLSPEERQLADLRAEGEQWETIAEKMGGTAQARRKQLARALDRVTQQLEFDPE